MSPEETGKIYVFILDSLRHDMKGDIFPEFNESSKVVANFGWSLPSHNAIFASHSADEVSTFSAGDKVKGSTIGKDLSDLGYRTCLVSPNAYFQKGHGYDDFDTVVEIDHSSWVKKISDKDRFDEFRGREKDLWTKAKSLIKASIKEPRLLLDGVFWFIGTRMSVAPGDSGLSEVLSGIEENKEHDFFAANLLTTHWPFLPPLRYWIRRGKIFALVKQVKFLMKHGKKLPTPLEDERSQKLQREAYALSRDYLYEKLSRWIEENTSEEDTVIITSDHGELLGEESNLMGHSYGFTPEVFHVPFFYRGDIDFPEFFGLDELYDKLMAHVKGQDYSFGDHTYFYKESSGSENESVWTKAQKGVITEEARKVVYEDGSITFKPFKNEEIDEDIDIEIPEVEKEEGDEPSEKIKKKLRDIGYM